MRRLLFVLLLSGCRTSAPTAETATIAPAAAPRNGEALLVTPGTPHVASVTFREHADLRQADFDVIGLPAVDTASDAFVVADLSRGHIVSSLSLSLHWLAPNEKEPFRSFVVLDAREASHVLYDIDDEDVPAAMVTLVPKVRARADGVNALLANTRLRPTTPCMVQSPEAGAGCVHPQTLTCGAHSFQLTGDRIGTKSLGWKIAPMQIGDGPPKEMVTCIEEAYLDERRLRLLARTETSCKGGGSDACYLPSEWRVTALR